MSDQAQVIDEQLLTPLLKRLVRCIGLPAALQLLRARGGTRLKIAQRGSPILDAIVGPEATAQLLAEFGGTAEITLPMPDKVLAQIRDRQIVAEHADGVSLMELALRYQLTTRSIQMIVGAATAKTIEQLQPDLFGPAPNARKAI
jgi:hypothetical protein